MTVAELIERLQCFDQGAQVELPNGELDLVTRVNSDRTVVRLVHFDSHQISEMKSRQESEIKRLRSAAAEQARKTVLPWEEQ